MEFKKYSCTGNDFIIFDNRKNSISFSLDKIINLCKRRTGIGADGIILLENSTKADFKMKIINSDGSEAEMCGNGLRGIAHYAFHVLKIPMKNSYTVETYNSIYQAKVKDNFVEIKMTEAYDLNRFDLGFIDIDKKFFINTGVPHVVLFVSDVDRVHVQDLGSQIRYNKIFPEGTNVNFVEVLDKSKQLIKVRTYERGVEEETLACGTGNLASALATQFFFNWQGRVNIQNRGGDVCVQILNNENWYAGEVDLVYSGNLDERKIR